MARRRYQKPMPKRRGKQWVIQVREDVFINGQRTRKNNRVVLGPSSLGKHEAERFRDDYLASINEASVGIGGACLFQDFVRVYKRDVLPMLSSTTQERTRSVLKNHLNPELGDLMLKEITLEVLQGYVTRLQATKLSAESVDKIRDVASAVLRTAVDYGRLIVNPAEKIRLKSKGRGLHKPKRFLRREEFTNLLAAIREPYSTMVFVAGLTGLRVSEVAALKWRNVSADSITIAQRYCRGDWDAPKSEASQATIAVPPEVLERLQRLKGIEVVIRAGRGNRRVKLVRSDGPDDLVFQSPYKGAPMRDNNILSRHIKPAANSLGIGWVNWQVLRRTCATWLQQAGVDVKDAQGLLRHSRASTTQDIYQQVVPESQRRAVGKLSAYTQTIMQQAVVVV
jgi:integrase